MISIPVSVLVTTRNEGQRIASCLAALSAFSEVVVIDSHSTDDTVLIAQSFGAKVVPFTWNGQYPKKRQWCLDHLTLTHDWVLFVDADEVVTPDLVDEIRAVVASPQHDGYFIDGLYVMNGRVLRYGLQNSKIILFHRYKFRLPVVNDLDLPGMGEMEGHYQPVPINGATIGYLRHPLLHFAYEGGEDWMSRHARYAQWEAGMNARKAWPVDPVPLRQIMKEIFRSLPCRGAIAFAHSYIWRRGFLDGYEGFALARDRYRYYTLVARNRQ